MILSSTAFSGPPNKINSPTLQTLPGGTQYPASSCVELAVQDSRSAYFTIDGTSHLSPIPFPSSLTLQVELLTPLPP